MILPPLVSHIFPIYWKSLGLIIPSLGSSQTFPLSAHLSGRRTRHHREGHYASRNHNAPCAHSSITLFRIYPLTIWAGGSRAGRVRSRSGRICSTKRAPIFNDQCRRVCAPR
jgi:hypothetical protein